MILTYLRTAFRQLKTNKATAAIHVIGLAVGMSAAIVIFLIIRYDYSFDKWEPGRENIYRVYTHFGEGGGNYGISLLAPPAIEEKVSGIEHLAHVLVEPFYNTTVRTGQNAEGKPNVYAGVEGIIAVDSSYFQIFARQWLAGSPAVLSELNTVVVTRQMAQRYFPGQSPRALIGKSLVLQDTLHMVISGVVADLRQNTDFDYQLFVSLSTFTQTALLNQVTSSPHWTNVDGSSQCFVRLLPGVDPASVNQQIQEIYYAHQEGTSQKDLSTGRLQPLSDIHFNTELDGKVSKSSLRNLMLLAVLLLALAVINFINLSTARSSLRAKEIGVRKTFGAAGFQIIKQFLSEILLITLLAAALALLLVPLLLHVFSGFIPDGLGVSQLLHPSILLFLLLLIPVVTLLSGLYPAVVLNRFRPALALKSKVNVSGKSTGTVLRESLIVVQFVLAQVFLIIVFVIGKQIDFELNSEIGMRKQAIVSIYIPDYGKMYESKARVLASELKSIPQIENLSLCSQTPLSGGWSSTSIRRYHNSRETEYNNVHLRTADDSYLSLFELQLVAGENLHLDSSSRVTDVLINETLCRQMGFVSAEQAVGTIISGGPSDSARIVGVLKDFTTMSLHHPIYPTAVFAGNDGFAPTLAIALAGQTPRDWAVALDKIQQSFQKIYPHKEFNARFLDETIRHLYSSDLRLSSLLKWATGLSVFISLMGLVGLVSFMAIQRSKEIAVRKVLGATATQIIGLLCKSMLRLVLLAAAIALPIGWYTSRRWLSDFAFQTRLSWWIFLVAALGMLLLALLILSLRTYKTAQANPLDSLKEN